MSTVIRGKSPSVNEYFCTLNGFNNTIATKANSKKGIKFYFIYIENTTCIKKNSKTCLKKPTDLRKTMRSNNDAKCDFVTIFCNQNIILPT